MKPITRTMADGPHHSRAVPTPDELAKELELYIATQMAAAGVGHPHKAARAPTAQLNQKPISDADRLAAALCAHAWAALDVPTEPRLLGDLLTSTARVFIVGSTGLGKTQLAHGMGAGMASGAGFVHWRCDKPSKVLVMDGEMSKSLIRERIHAALRRSDPVAAERLTIYALDRSEHFAQCFPSLGLFEPLNTAAGHEFMMRLVASIKPDVIIFDNVMSLISGDQKDEIPWSETLPLVAKITALGIGQVWLDHTGHDKSRQYGSSTKGWRFDAVGIMTTVEDVADGEVSFQLSFDAPAGKARRRAPDNWQDFAPHRITLAGDVWFSEPLGKKASQNGVQRVKPFAEKWYDALLNALCVSSPPGSVTEDEWLAEGIRMGLTEAQTEDDTRTSKDQKRAKFRAAKSMLASDLLDGKKPRSRPAAGR
jgi:hypothetical protein